MQDRPSPPCTRAPGERSRESYGYPIPAAGWRRPPSPAGSPGMQPRTEGNRRRAAGHRKTEAWHPPAMGVPEKAAHPSGLASWQRPCGPLSRRRLAVARGNPRGLSRRRLPTWLWPVSCSLWVWVSLASPTTPHLPGGEAGRIQVGEPRRPQASRSPRRARADGAGTEEIGFSADGLP